MKVELDNVVPIDADTARLLAHRRLHFRWFVALLAAVYVSVLAPILLFTPLPPPGPFVMLAILVVLAEHRFVLFGDETSMSASIIVVVASVFVFADRSPPHSVTSSLLPSLGRKRASPRKNEACACQLEALYRKFVTRSGIGYSALPSIPEGTVMLDLLSSTATDHDPLAPSFDVQRACA